VAAAIAAPTAPAPEPIRPVNVTLHRFDLAPGSDAKLRNWVDFLHRRHRNAVATLLREHTYFEAMFRGADEPNHLYWITVQGAAARGWNCLTSTWTSSTWRT